MPPQTTPDAHQSPAQRRRARRARRLVLASLAVIVVVFAIGYAVLPTRAWLAQRDEIALREQRLAEIEAANAALGDRVRALQSPDEIERIARRDLGLVMPGEEPYVVLPPAPEPIRLPEAWPFTALADALGG